MLASSPRCATGHGVVDERGQDAQDGAERGIAEHGGGEDGEIRGAGHAPRIGALAGPQVAERIEVLARVAPAAPVRSLREGTRAQALRAARTCYDHLAGRLGVALMQALIRDAAVVGGDGRHRLDGGGADRLSAPGRDVDYRLTAAGAQRLAQLGVELPDVGADGLAVRYCVDWSEQAHHISGPVGRELARRLLELGWLRRAERSRAVHITDAGRHGLRAQLGVELPPAA